MSGLTLYDFRMTRHGEHFVYEFGGFELDARQRVLRTAAGEPVPLQPRVLETLLFLVERGDELLDKDTLMKAIWPNVIVEENSLNQNISLLRRVLGENRDDRRFIVTVPGRGYRFVASVTKRAAGAITSSPGPQPSIAVLPFANLTGDPAKEYLADGMAEELIHALTRVPGLRVTARTSSFAYKGRAIDIRRIGAELGVTAVLEGSVRSTAQRLRITAQLIDAQTGFHFWSQSIDRRLEDLFVVQEELASSVLHALEVPRAGSRQIGDSSSPAPTNNLDAYHLYLQSRPLVVRPSEQNLRGAEALLERAIALDPKFARAFAYLANVRTVLLMFGFARDAHIATAERDVLQALVLDPMLGPAHANLGQIRAMQGRWLEAEEHYDKAATVADDPETRAPRTIALSMAVGHGQKALAEAVEMQRSAPSLPLANIGAALAHLSFGEDAEALRFVDIAISLGQPRELAPVADVKSQVAVRAGRFSEAADLMLASLRPALLAAGADNAVRLVFAALQDPAQKPAAIRTLESLEAAVGAHSLALAEVYRLALWYTMLGALDNAFASISRALDALSRQGIIGFAWGWLWLAEMRPFREHARFQSLAERLGLVEYWRQRGAPDGHELRDGQVRVL